MAKAGLAIELYRPAAYHCQQAIEKALKGYLAFKKQPIIKIHDLMKLLTMCQNIDRSFKRHHESIRFINPFATKFRYPSEFDLPDKTEMELALKYTNQIVRFVLKKFKEPETGQQSLFQCNTDLQN